MLAPYRDLFVDNASTFFGSVHLYHGVVLGARRLRETRPTRGLPPESPPTSRSPPRRCSPAAGSNGPPRWPVARAGRDEWATESSPRAPRGRPTPIASATARSRRPQRGAALPARPAGRLNAGARNRRPGSEGTKEVLAAAFVRTSGPGGSRGASDLRASPPSSTTACRLVGRRPLSGDDVGIVAQPECSRRCSATATG